jgi:YidC/Oxa1 family membrane protein insertase
MQDQGKRLLIAVALALGVMLVWTTMSPKEEPKPTTGSGQVGPKPATPQVGVASTGSASAATPVAGTAAAPAPAEEAPRPPEAPITLSFDNLVATFSNYCGGLKTWKLTDERYVHDATHGFLLPEKSLMTTTDGTGKRVPVAAEQLARLPDCGAFEVNFASSTFVVPRHAVWRGEQLSKTAVR